MLLSNIKTISNVTQLNIRESVKQNNIKYYYK